MTTFKTEKKTWDSFIYHKIVKVGFGDDNPSGFPRFTSKGGLYQGVEGTHMCLMHGCAAHLRVSTTILAK